MPAFAETADWGATIDYFAPAGSYGYLQPGYQVSGSLDEAAGDGADLIQVPMANGFTYSFVFAGDPGVSFTILDDFGNVIVSGSMVEFTPEHPSTHFYIEAAGTGSYSVAMAGVAADTMPDEDGGVLNPIPIELGSAVSGLINGNVFDTSEPDHYSFYAEAGQVIAFQMSPADSVFGPTAGGWLHLYDAAGTEITGTSWGATAWDDGASLNWTVTASGWYVISADTYGFNYAGSYVLETTVGSSPGIAGTLPLDPQVHLAGSTLMDGGDNWFEQVELGLSGPAAADIAVEVTVRAFDAAGTATPVVTTYQVMIPAGEVLSQVVLNLGTQEALTGLDRFEVSVSHVVGAGLVADQAFGAVQAPADAVPGPLWVEGTDAGETLTGTAFGDSLAGLGGADLVLGLDGGDLLSGGDGNDRMLGGEGDDTMEGDAGRDRLVGEAGNDDMSGGSEQDTLLGYNGDDTLNGDGGDDVLRGGGDQDLENGGAGNDIVIGGTGRDTLNGDEGNDTLRGNGGFDTVDGGEGDDLVAGGAQADLVLGGAGDDTLQAGGGFDTLDGGDGNDELTGNFNADRFVFHDGDGNDTITDFEATNNAEKIDLSDVSAIASLADLNLGSATLGAATQVGADVVIDTGGGNSITLLGVDLADLDASDFIF
ncbi:MAG: hypothetical protein R3D85_07100 [Paracoccaceae bacterium]